METIKAIGKLIKWVVVAVVFLFIMSFFQGEPVGRYESGMVWHYSVVIATSAVFLKFCWMVLNGLGKLGTAIKWISLPAIIIFIASSIEFKLGGSGDSVGFVGTFLVVVIAVVTVVVLVVGKILISGLSKAGKSIDKSITEHNAKAAVAALEPKICRWMVTVSGNANTPQTVYKVAATSRVEAEEKAHNKRGFSMVGRDLSDGSRHVISVRKAHIGDVGSFL